MKGIRYSCLEHKRRTKGCQECAISWKIYMGWWRERNYEHYLTITKKHQAAYRRRKKERRLAEAA